MTWLIVRPAGSPPELVVTRATVCRIAGLRDGARFIAYIIPSERTSRIARVSYAARRYISRYDRQLNAGGRDLPRGKWCCACAQPRIVHDRIAQLARETGVEVTAVNTGFSEAGDTGIGSETVVSLKRPRIIVVADEPVSQTSYGAMWWLFDGYGVDFTPMTVDAIKRARLDSYNVIIMPDGSAGRYFAALGRAA